MKELLKNQYKNVILVSVYTALAIAVYSIWAHSLWKLWFIDLIVGIVILAIGVVVGYFYIKSEDKKNKAKDNIVVEEKNTIEIVEETTIEQDKKNIENEQ